MLTVRKQLITIALAAIALTPDAHAQTIGFDDISCGNIGAAIQVPAGYAGLTWTGFRCYDVTTTGNPAYFAAARTSGTNIAINRGGSGSNITSTTTFNFLSARLTTSDPGVTYLFEGWLGTTRLFSTLVDSPAARSFQTFNFIGIDRMEMTRTVGGGIFAFDDIDIGAPTSTVPEPATAALLGAGLLVVGGLVRRRRPQH